ncbi:MAG: N-acetyltransferase family protein [Bacillota bacterium]
MAIMIREATLGDLEGLCRLYHAFHEFHVQGVPDRLISLGSYECYDRARLERSLHEIMARDDAIIFVAEDSDRLVGLAEAYLREDNPTNAFRVSRKHIYLQSLMVADDSRRLGVGRKLVEAVHACARERGATEVQLETWEFPGGPQRFYEAMGYRTLRRTLVCDLVKSVDPR